MFTLLNFGDLLKNWRFQRDSTVSHANISSWFLNFQKDLSNHLLPARNKFYLIKEVSGKTFKGKHSKHWLNKFTLGHSVLLLWNNWFVGLGVFYGILALTNYLMPNPVHIYIYIYIYIYMICKRIVYKWHYFKTSQNSFVCVQLNGSEYCYPTLIIRFNINHSFAHSFKWFEL